MRDTVLDLAQSAFAGRPFKRMRGGAEVHGPCLRCARSGSASKAGKVGGEDRFVIFPGEGREQRGKFWCRRCDWKGDVIDYASEITGDGYLDALARLSIERGEAPMLGALARRRRRSSTLRRQSAEDHAAHAEARARRAFTGEANTPDTPPEERGVLTEDEAVAILGERLARHVAGQTAAAPGSVPVFSETVLGEAHRRLMAGEALDADHRMAFAAYDASGGGARTVPTAQELLRRMMHACEAGDVVEHRALTVQLARRLALLLATAHRYADRCPVSFEEHAEEVLDRVDGALSKAGDLHASARPYAFEGTPYTFGQRSPLDDAGGRMLFMLGIDPARLTLHPARHAPTPAHLAPTPGTTRHDS